MDNRFETMEQAEARAQQLTQETGEQHIAYKSDYAFQPFVAERMPQVGDEVSMAFNGDSYPCGKIASISKTYSRIRSDDGVVFTRVGPNRWKRGGKDGTFSMIRGHRDEQNPHL